MARCTLTPQGDGYALRSPYDAGPGRAFLDKLARLTGGTSAQTTIPQLAASIAGLLR